MILKTEFIAILISLTNQRSTVQEKGKIGLEIMRLNSSKDIIDRLRESRVNVLSKRRGRYFIDFDDNQGKRRRNTLKKSTTQNSVFYDIITPEVFRCKI